MNFSLHTLCVLHPLGFLLHESESVLACASLVNLLVPVSLLVPVCVHFSVCVLVCVFYELCVCVPGKGLNSVFIEKHRSVI